MAIHSDSSLVPDLLPGLAHRTLAGAAHGLERLAVWSQQIDPEAGTPPHRHDCEEVVLIQQGVGTLVENGEARRFAAGDTLIVPPDVEHQILNTGAEPLRLVAVFSTAQVDVRWPDGKPLELPWD